MLGKLLLAGVALWMAAPPGNTAKTRNIEHRLNTAMPRIPWPQPNPGPAGNSSYGPGNNSWYPTDSSYPIGYYDDRIGQSDQGSTSSPTVYNVSGWYAGTGAHNHTIDHAHNMPHGHIYGGLANDFNTLQNSHNATIGSVQALQVDHSALVSTVSALRTSHSNHISAYNDLIGRLNNAGILQ